ncbi:MAG: O-acetyl-ADP-ribose deacetylase [Patescibacteria group bacterium]
MMNLFVVQSDITKIAVDAIVNPANETLLGGGGCDGAIHNAAGSNLLKECRTLNGCKKGEAKITEGYNLPAKHIIHTVGPVYGQENGEEDEILTNCYHNCFKLAKENKIKTIALPCISTGCYKFPKDEAAKIAIKVAKQYADNFEKIIFVCFSELDYRIYQKLINNNDNQTDIPLNSL